MSTSQPAASRATLLSVGVLQSVASLWLMHASLRQTSVPGASIAEKLLPGLIVVAPALILMWSSTRDRGYRIRHRRQLKASAIAGPILCVALLGLHIGMRANPGGQFPGALGLSSYVLASIAYGVQLLSLLSVAVSRSAMRKNGT